MASEEFMVSEAPGGAAQTPQTRLHQTGCSRPQATPSHSPTPSPAGAAAVARQASGRRSRRKSSITYVSTPTPSSSRVATPVTASEASSSPSPSPRHRSQLSISSTTSLPPISERHALSPTPAETAMDKTSRLLSLIAAHERECLELREQLARHEAEVTRLRAEWKETMAQTLAQQRAPAAEGGHTRSLSQTLSGALQSEDEGAPDLAAVQAAATHALKGWSGRLHTFLEDALAVPPAAAEHKPPPPRPGPARVASESSTERSRDPTPTLPAREFPLPRTHEEGQARPLHSSPSSETLHSPPREDVPDVPKRTSLFSLSAGGWDWTGRLQEARSGAEALLAKAERGLEGLIVLDDPVPTPAPNHWQSAAERERTLLRTWGEGKARAHAPASDTPASAPPAQAPASSTASDPDSWNW